MKNYKEYIKVNWSYRDELLPSKYSETAYEAIISGETHPAIIELATLHNPEMVEIDDLLNRYLKDFYIPKKLAMQYLVKEITLKIIDKLISPYEGTCDICEYYYTNEYPNELINFWRLK